MATSGSNTTWSSNGGHYVKVTWNETSQSTVENRSAVTVRLYVGSKSGWSISDSSNSYSLIINGTTYSGSNANISQTGSEDLIMSQSVIINHNSDGTKSFSMKGSVSGLYFGGITGTTFTGTLDTIARASSITGTASMTAGWSKAVGISRASSSFSHTLHIYLTKSGVGDDLIRSENFSTSQTSKTLEWTDGQINDMFNEGHGYWTGTKFVLITYSGSTEIGRNTYTGSLDWPSNNSVGSMENSINAGESFNVNISKASSLYSHEAKLTLTDGTSLATRSITSGTSFQMTPSASTIYSRTVSSTSISVQLWIRTVLTGATGTEVRDWTLEKTSTVYIPEAPPIVGTMSYTELNSAVATAISSSGTNPPLVQGYSHPRFTFTAATGQNNATITNYIVSIGGESLSRTSAGSLDFTPTNLSGRTIKVGGSTSGTLTVIDSRGFSSTLSIPVSYMPYNPPSLTVALKRLNGFSDTVELTGSASISSLGGANAVAGSGGFKYRWRQLPSGTFTTTFTNLSSTIVLGNPTITKLTQTMSNENSFEFEITVTDKITTTTVKRVAGAGKPIAFIDSKLLSVGVNRFPTETSQFEVQDKMMVFPSLTATTKAGSGFTANTNKSFIHFKQMTGSNDPGYIMHETSATTADLNKGVLHLCPSDDNENTNDYVTIHGTNQAETIKLYTGGNATFNGIVSVGELSTTKINVVGTNLEIANSSAEILKLTANSGTYGYMSIYNGASRVGYIGSISNNSTSVRVASDTGWLDFAGNSGVNVYVGGSSRLHITGTTTTSANNIEVSGSVNATTLSASTVTGTLEHSNGYVGVNSFSTGTYGTGKGEFWYRADTRRFSFSSRNPGDSGAQNVTVYAATFTSTSKRDAKEFIEHYSEDALSKIKDTKIRTYNYKGMERSDRRVGVIIEDGVPEEIISATRDGIDAYSMTAMTWKAIQQMEAKNDYLWMTMESINEENKSLKKEKTAMKSRMTKLEKKNKELEERLARIEALLEGGN